MLAGFSYRDPGSNQDIGNFQICLNADKGVFRHPGWSCSPGGRRRLIEHVGAESCTFRILAGDRIFELAIAYSRTSALSPWIVAGWPRQATLRVFAR